MPAADSSSGAPPRRTPDSRRSPRRPGRRCGVRSPRTPAASPRPRRRRRSTSRGPWSIAVVGAAEDWLPVYEASGLRSVYLGDEAIVDCREFSLEGHPRKSLRQASGRVRRAGFTAAFLDVAGLDDATRASLEQIATANRRGEAERGFSMPLSRLFDPADPELMLTVVRDREGVPQAFIQWAPAPGLQGWSLDVMRSNRDEQLPNGLTDFAIIATIRHVAESGGRALSLNFAVFRG